MKRNLTETSEKPQRSLCRNPSLKPSKKFWIFHEAPQKPAQKLKISILEDLLASRNPLRRKERVKMSLSEALA